VNNVWAKAMNRVINEKIALDEMIARIKQIAAP
jgi:hypothetical protein